MPEARCTACGSLFEMDEPQLTARCPDCGYHGEVNEVITDDDLLLWCEDEDDESFF